MPRLRMTGRAASLADKRRERALRRHFHQAWARTSGRGNRWCPAGRRVCVCRWTSCVQPCLCPCGGTGKNKAGTCPALLFAFFTWRFSLLRRRLFLGGLLARHRTHRPLPPSRPFFASWPSSFLERRRQRRPSQLAFFAVFCSSASASSAGAACGPNAPPAASAPYRGVVARTRRHVQDARVATRTRLEARADDFEQLGDDLGVAQARERQDGVWLRCLRLPRVISGSTTRRSSLAFGTPWCGWSRDAAARPTGCGAARGGAAHCGDSWRPER